MHGHVPVLRDRVTELIADPVREMGDKAVIVDGTLGAGGHAEFFLRSFPKACVIGLDRDRLAAEGAQERLATYGERFGFYHTRFDGLGTAIETGEGEPFERARAYGVAG